jgi:hypothetical protein
MLAIGLRPSRPRPPPPDAGGPPPPPPAPMPPPTESTPTDRLFTRDDDPTEIQ